MIASYWKFTGFCWGNKKWQQIRVHYSDDYPQICQFVLQNMGPTWKQIFRASSDTSGSDIINRKYQTFYVSLLKFWSKMKTTPLWLSACSLVPRDDLCKLKPNFAYLFAWVDFANSTSNLVFDFLFIFGFDASAFPAQLDCLPAELL